MQPGGDVVGLYGEGVVGVADGDHAEEVGRLHGDGATGPEGIVHCC